MTRRAFSAGLMALPAAPAFASAGSHIALAEAARGLAPEGLTVLAPLGSEANLRPIADAFKKISGIDVKVETTGVRDVGSRLMIQHMSSGSGWDVALPAAFELPDLIAAGAVRPMPETAQLSTADHPIYPHGTVYEDRRYGFQTDGDLYMLFYNAKFYENPRLAGLWEDRRGIPFDLPRSWTEFDAQMRHVVDVDPNLRGGSIRREEGFIEIEFWLRLLAKGVWPLDADFMPQIAGDAGIAAVEDMIAIDDALAPQGPSEPALTTWRRFESGKTLAIMSYGGLQKYLNRRGGPLAGQLLFSVPPGGEGEDTPDDLPSFSWGWCYSVPTGTRNPEAAALFSAFAVSPTPSTEAIRIAEGFFDPFLDRHYGDKVIAQVYGEPFLKVHHDAMTRSMPDFYVPGRGVYMASLGRWLRLALDGALTPRAALDSAANDWNVITDTLDRASQADRWRALRAAFPNSIASKLRDPGMDAGLKSEG